MTIFMACVVLGVLIAIGMFAFRMMGGAFASANMRQRMKTAGFDPASSRLEEWGLEENKKEEN